MKMVIPHYVGTCPLTECAAGANTQLVTARRKAADSVGKQSRSFRAQYCRQPYTASNNHQVRPIEELTST